MKPNTVVDVNSHSHEDMAVSSPEIDGRILQHCILFCSISLLLPNAYHTHTHTHMRARTPMYFYTVISVRTMCTMIYRVLQIEAREIAMKRVFFLHSFYIVLLLLQERISKSTSFAGNIFCIGKSFFSFFSFIFFFLF